ncbi:uncharacterized protein TRAVEDRAFT_73572 [Trametes versicolor FP-101664 SS1]|uniref:uncharacterized protein n=1 Tax=Trametes versicolor (strain FP-101664) TaxID=717944 RepID=UPI0004623A6E|nr:uncharacterized protein TRAVEDRAFT_73572 [Trametes versicolor FP-101664 SS1]EIW55784.1 hypothetical protein TRAVEDRAFT_73572 [Trametes versicolor FP-101664 SS1]
MLLRIAKEVSTELPVPGLSTALEIAVNIAEQAKEVKDTRDGCRSLAERATYFAWGVYDQLKHCDVDTQSISTKEHVQLLLCMLCEIEGLMKRRRRMRALTFLRRHADVAQDVQKLNIQLEDAIKLFTMQTGIDIEQKMDVLLSTNVRLLQHVEDSARVGDALLWEARDIRIGVCDLAQRLHGSATYEGNFRLFSRENLDLVEPIYNTVSRHTLPRQADDHALSRRVAQQRKGRVVRYRATVKAAGELSGTQVVVHVYPARDKSGFMEAVTCGHQTCNPYILAMLGYSRPGTVGEAPYIVTEDYSPLTEYLRSLHGTDLFRAILRMTMDICMAVDHLETIELHRQVLCEEDYWAYGPQYEFTLGDLVFDHRHGGRIKWARDPLREAADSDAFAPATLEDRACLMHGLQSR